MNETTFEIREYFDRQSVSWDSGRIRDGRKLDSIVAISNMPRNGRILDVACGTGIMIPSLLKFYPTELCGIDLSPKMIEIARAKFPGSTISFISGDILEYTDGNFDGIMLYNAYPHFSDKRALIKKLSELLGNGGQIAIAHGLGRERINSAHRKKGLGNITSDVLPAGDEAVIISEFIDIDTVVDNPDMFIIAGRKRSR